MRTDRIAVKYAHSVRSECAKGAEKLTKFLNVKQQGRLGRVFHKRKDHQGYSGQGQRFNHGEEA